MDTETRSHVHALVDRLPPVQLAALETILQSMLDPLSRKLAMAPIDDEPFALCGGCTYVATIQIRAVGRGPYRFW